MIGYTTQTGRAFGVTWAGDVDRRDGATYVEGGTLECVSIEDPDALADALLDASDRIESLQRVVRLLLHRPDDRELRARARRLADADSPRDEIEEEVARG